MPPDGVLWYTRDREVRCARFTRRNAFFDRRGLPPSMESFEAFMLITFRSQAYANITMFGDIAVSLLKMMGHSGTVSGAILAEDVPAALDRLKKALAADRSAAVAAPADDAKDDDEDSKEPPVSLAQHAFPLLQLLEAAARTQRDMMWDRTA